MEYKQFVETYDSPKRKGKEYYYRNGQNNRGKNSYGKPLLQMPERKNMYRQLTKPTPNILFSMTHSV